MSFALRFILDKANCVFLVYHPKNIQKLVEAGGVEPPSVN